MKQEVRKSLFWSEAQWMLPEFEEFGIEKESAEEKMSLAEYLDRGQKILSCVRERKPRERTVRSVYDAVNTRKLWSLGEYAQMDYINERISAVLLPKAEEKILSQMAKGRVDFEAFYDLMGHPENLKLELLSADANGTRIVQGIMKDKSVVVLGVSIHGEETVYCPIGTRLKKSKAGRMFYFRRARKETECIVNNIGNLLGPVIILAEIQKYLSEHTRDLDDPVRTVLQGMIDKEIERYRKSGLLCISGRSASDEQFLSYLKEQGIGYYVEEPNGDSFDRRSLFLLRLSEGWKVGIAEYKQNAVWAAPLFRMILTEYFKDAQTEKYNRNQSGERAAVWETKKNIPDRIVEEMMRSKFNEHFGYVEFDEQVDLSSMREIEKEWEAIHAILHLNRQERTAIRFRRLGNYHAAGMYWPSLRCLCVDIRHPDSMVHEYFHLLDYEMGGLSRKSSFMECERIYTKEICAFVEQEGPESGIYKQWNGNGKYNRNYYLEPTEIFARCGELFMTKVLKVSNSLCVPDSGFAYPDSKELICVIEKYYGQLLDVDREMVEALIKENGMMKK